MGEKNIKCVIDLGVAAYLLMHAHQVIGKKGRSIYFQCDNDEECRAFDKLILDYQPPNDFYTFDSCLMFLKKINECGLQEADEETHKIVSDLGVAAYLLLHEYKSNSIGVKVVGRRGKAVYFECPKDKEKEFNSLIFQYLPSQFHQYDSCLMSLKKIGEYIPTQD